jgi:hypothetical protein
VSRKLLLRDLATRSLSPRFNFEPTYIPTLFFRYH